MPQTPNPQESLRHQNDALIKNFSDSLQANGMEREAAEGHSFNLDFYLNHYLLHNGAHKPENGVALELVRDFLGNYFVHKAMWTDVEEQKSSIHTILLFFDWMQEKGRVASGDVQTLRDVIAAEQESWFAAMERYSEESLETWQAVNDSDLIDDELYLDFGEEENNEVDEFSLIIEDIGIPTTDDSGLEELEDVAELEPHVEDDDESDNNN